MIPEPTTDGERCLVCERLLFPKDDYLCGDCERATDPDGPEADDE